MKFVLLLVFLARGELNIVQKGFKDADTCNSVAKAEVARINALPEFEHGILAACIPATAVKL